MHDVEALLGLTPLTQGCKVRLRMSAECPYAAPRGPQRGPQRDYYTGINTAPEPYFHHATLLADGLEGVISWLADTPSNRHPYGVIFSVPYEGDTWRHLAWFARSELERV